MNCTLEEVSWQLTGMLYRRSKGEWGDGRVTQWILSPSIFDGTKNTGLDSSVWDNKNVIGWLTCLPGVSHTLLQRVPVLGSSGSLVSPGRTSYRWREYSPSPIVIHSNFNRQRRIRPPWREGTPQETYESYCIVVAPCFFCFFLVRRMLKTTFLENRLERLLRNLFDHFTTLIKRPDIKGPCRPLNDYLSSTSNLWTVLMSGEDSRGKKQLFPTHFRRTSQPFRPYNSSFS